MSGIIKETVVTKVGEVDQTASAPEEKEATSLQTIAYLVYFLFGALDVLLMFRLVFKLLGASLSSNFVGFIYGITDLFIAPFEGIFSREFAEGAETTAILEPSTIVAILVYAVLAWGIVKLVHVLSGKQQTE